MFVSTRYTLLYFNTIYVNKNQHSPQIYPLLSTNVVVSLLHRLMVARLRINKMYIKKQIKLKESHIYTKTIPQAKFPYFSTASIYESSLILVITISCICLSLRTYHGGSCTKPLNCSDKIKMPKSTTGCRRKSFIRHFRPELVH